MARKSKKEILLNECEMAIIKELTFWDDGVEEKALESLVGIPGAIIHILKLQRQGFIEEKSDGGLVLTDLGWNVAIELGYARRIVI